MVGFARDDLDITVRLRVAVLDSADWGRVTSTPYSLPTNSGLGADDLLLAAVEPPGRVGARRMPAEQISDFLTVGHEGGHLLTWQLLPDAVKAAASTLADPSASTTENLVAQLESIAPGATTLLTRLGAEWK